MTLPTKAEYLLAHKDRYGRFSRLVGERDGGVVHWSIRSDAISQRDEGEIIRSLTTDQLVEIGEIAASLADAMRGFR